MRKRTNNLMGARNSVRQLVGWVEGFRDGAFGEVHFIDYRPGMSDNYGVDILGSGECCFIGKPFIPN